MNISRYLDHAVLKPGMSRAEAESAIRVGVRYGVKTVCVRPCDIALASDLCRDSRTDVCCVLDFPHGTGGAQAKKEMAGIYIENGVKELDMVINYGYALGGEWDAVEDEIFGVTECAYESGALVKVIFETSEWPMERIARGVETCVKAGADFVKTSTGFSANGATEDVVREMLRAAGDRILVKASGGIRDYTAAQKYIAMGCARLGEGYSSTSAICDG